MCADFVMAFTSSHRSLHFHYLRRCIELKFIVRGSIDRVERGCLDILLTWASWAFFPGAKPPTVADIVPSRVWPCYRDTHWYWLTHHTFLPDSAALHPFA